MDLENYWLWNILLSLAFKVFSRIYTAIYPNRNRPRNRRLIEFEAAVSSLIQSLKDKPDELDGLFSITEWHFNSIRQLKPHADYLRKFYRKTWDQIKDSYDEYQPPPNDSDPEHKDTYRYLLHGIDRESLIDKLNKLLYSIENAQ